MVSLKSSLEWVGTEFGGGTLVGGEDLAVVLFVLAPILIFRYPRSAAICGLVACYESLPLYLYLVFPIPFRRWSPGKWATWYVERESFVWNGWSIMGILFALLVAFLCGSILLRSFSAQKPAGVEP